MIQISAEINSGGEKSHFSHTIGEQIVSDKGFITVALGKTTTPKPYNSITMRCEVTLPLDEGLREESLDQTEDAFNQARSIAEEYLELLTVKLG